MFLADPNLLYCEQLQAATLVEGIHAFQDNSETTSMHAKLQLNVLSTQAHNT